MHFFTISTSLIHSVYYRSRIQYLKRNLDKSAQDVDFFFCTVSLHIFIMDSFINSKNKVPKPTPLSLDQ
ncbi:hypothetical protein AQUCO_01900038v1 [Aquilegia coerulea]|uniref:Uncharacterized protein n=1 Tax=Aquilegia coerulea TaxID=218851 RepID=A0A2G5DIP4_AQUCA|nr:hypothetical protein AQUCO_01900038v1 [Aquilegia coerulea]